MQVWIAVIRKGDRVRRLADRPLAAAIEEAADAAESQPDHQTRRDDIHPQRQRNLFLSRIPDQHDEGEDKPAVIGQPAGGEVDHGQEILESRAMGV